MEIHKVQQGTDEWLELRKRKLTGTNAKYVIGYKEMLKADLVCIAEEKGIEFDSTTKVEELKALILEVDPNFSFRKLEEKVNEDFTYKMLALDLTGEMQEVESDNPLQRGHDLEPVARKIFEKAKGKEVEEIGFVTLDEEPRIGLSPDGLIKNNGKYTEGLEIKSPVAWKYLKYWLENKVPDEYFDQCLHYFVQDEAIEKVYLMIYNPAIKIHPFHIYELERSKFEWEIQVLKSAQIAFWKTHDKRLEEIKLLANK